MLIFVCSFVRPFVRFKLVKSSQSSSFLDTSIYLREHVSMLKFKGKYFRLMTLRDIVTNIIDT